MILRIFFFSLLKLFNKKITTNLVTFLLEKPIQLYAFLESVEQYITGINQINIIYRTSSQEIESAYSYVKARFKHARMVRQAHHERDFKELVIEHAFTSPSDYIIFGVDDIFVKN